MLVFVWHTPCESDWGRERERKGVSRRVKSNTKSDKKRRTSGHKVRRLHSLVCYTGTRAHIGIFTQRFDARALIKMIKRENKIADFTYTRQMSKPRFSADSCNWNCLAGPFLYVYLQFSFSHRFPLLRIILSLFARERLWF